MRKSLLRIFVMTTVLLLLLQGFIYGEQRSSVSQFGITWYFDSQYECGQFVTGDWWVVGPVTITHTDPAQTPGRNGSILNPEAGKYHGYDDRSAGGNYVESLRVTFPVTVSGLNSLVTSTSLTRPKDCVTGAGIDGWRSRLGSCDNRSTIETMGVLTIVDGPVPAGTFRPSFVGSDYKEFNSVADVCYAVLPRLPKPGMAPNVADILKYMDRPTIDHFNGWTTQLCYAVDNGAGYGSEITRNMAEIAISLMFDYAEDELQLMANLMVQRGIDTYGSMRNGAYWPSDGGHASGRKLPVLIAGKLLNHQGMLNIGHDYGRITFGEDCQTYFDGNNFPRWGIRNCQDPNRPDYNDESNNYRLCCTSKYWGSESIVAQILGLRDEWNHEAFFAYCNRFRDEGGGISTHTPSYGSYLFDTYRSNLPAEIPYSCGGPTDTIPPSTPNGLTATNITGNSLQLSWNASTDNIGVTRYEIYVDDVLNKSVSASATSTDVTGLVCNTTYTLKVKALDSRWNESALSNPLNATTTNVCDPINVALNKPVTVSAYQDDSDGTFPGNLLVDGNTSNEARWSASGYPQWAEIDLGANRDFTNVELYTYQNRAYQYIVEAKEDGGTYTTIVDRSSNITGGSPIADIIPLTSARYIKITVTGSSVYTGTWVSLNELKIIGPPDDMPRVPIEDVIISNATLNIETGASSNLSVTIAPTNATDKSVSWSSDNITVATVNGSGLVTAISEGTVIITATSNDSIELYDNCTVTVTEPQSVPVNNVDIVDESITLVTGQSSTLTATVSPSNATDKMLSWSSDNTAVATVNGSGSVTAVSTGAAVITATSNSDPVFSDNCNVTVTSLPDDGAYYCDPIAGSMSNNGSESSPWGSLEAVITAGITFDANDIIYLKNGNHGWPSITQSNSGVVTIKSYPGHDPVINRLDFTNASNWKVEGVRIYSPTAPPAAPVLEHPVYGIYDNYLVRLYESTNITLDNLYIYSIENSSAWTADDWNYKAWCGVIFKSYSNNNTIKNCTLKNVNFAIDMSYSSSINVQNNTIQNFCGDGLRVSTNCLVENNQIIDCYKTNGNHADAMQAFASSGAIIRNNTIISATSDRPFMGYELQGMGLFDGFFDNYTIENNLMIIHTWHGISLYGARNCKVANNTVVENPLGTNTAGPPWIAVYNHKDGSASYGNSLINNITSNIESTIGSSLSNNIVTADYASYFVNYTGLDFHLKNGSPAINAGTNTNAPSVDLEGVVRPQDGIVDVGCYEYNGVVTIIDVTGVTVTPQTLELELGQTSQLVETVEPSNATNQNITWSSDNTSVVTINGGQVNAIGTGSATVTVTTVDGGYTASCVVTVIEPSGDYNLAFNKPITVSAFQNDGFGYNPGENLVDGNVSDDARWSAEGYPQWAEIDLGENYDLSQIDVYPYQNRAYQYIVEAKADGGSYAVIVDKSANTESADLLASPVSTTARYVKITISGLYGNSSTWVSLSELEVWGSASAVNNEPTINNVSDVIVLDNAGTQPINLSGISDGDGNTQTVTVSASSSDDAVVSNVVVNYVSGNSTGSLSFDPVAPGTAAVNITVTDDGGTANGGDDSKQISFNVTVEPACLPVYDVALDRTSDTLSISQTVQLTAVVLPECAPAQDKNVTWSSSNATVATVNGSGLVTAISVGTATITVTTEVGGFIASYDVTVLPVDPTSVALNQASLVLGIAQTTQLTETVLPSNATDKSVTWSTSNSSIASVSNGLVTANNAGNATITVTTVNGLTATCNVTVNSVAPGETIPGKIEAEDYITALGINTESTTDVGGGLNVAWISTGDWMRYQINVLTAGEYTIKYRVASTGTSGQLQLQKGTTIYHTVNVPNTGGWQNWTTIEATANLEAGVQEFKIYASSGGWNINWFEGVLNATIHPTSVALNPTSLVLDIAQTAQLTETVLPSDATDKSVTWNSSDISVATVDANGLVTAVSEGSATITVSTNDGGYTANCDVTVTIPVIPVTGVTVSSSTLDLEEGQTSQLTETVSPANATDKSVSWSSTNSSVATVNASGLVTAIAEGSATITVTTNDGDYTANCDVTVTIPVVPVTGVTVSSSTLELEEGQTSQLTETVSPANATDKSVSWSSTNSSVATVNAGGLVTAISAGSATISVTTNDGSFTANCAVTVNSVPLVNLALNRPAVASSVQNSGLAASYAVDGNSGTRWASLQSDPQWIYVDLGQSYTISQVVLSWEAAYGSVYEIQVSDDATNWNSIYNTSSGDGGTDDITGLSGNGRYVRMYGTSRGTQWGYSLYEFEVYGPGAGGSDTEDPSIPTGLATGTVSETSVALSWTASTDNIGVIGYKVYTNGSNPQTVTGTSATISGLSASTQYSFTVSAIDAAGNESAQSSAIQVTTSTPADTEAPSVPTSLAAGTVTNSSVALSWTASTDNVGVTGYKVYTNGSNPQTVTGTSATISSLAASTQYSFTVSAIDAAGNESAQSSSISVTTSTPADTETPSIPTGLAAGTVTSSSVALSWTASTDNVGVTGYKVYTNGTNPQTVANTSATISGLSASTQYSFTVSAIDAAGNESAQSSSISVITLQAPSGITSSATWQSFQVSTLTGLFTATFDAVPNGSGIDAVTGIQNGTASAYADLACIVRFNSTGQIDARNGGSYAASNTINYTAGTSYHFRLEINVSTHTYFVYVTPQGGTEQTVASNFAFRSEQASVSQLTGWSVYALSGSHTVSNMVFTPAPPDTEAPSVPTGLVASDITSLSFILNWAVSTDNVGVTGYEVFQDGVSLGTTANTSFPVTGLSPSTTYGMTVSAIDGAGNESAQSVALNVTTDVPDLQDPSIPTGLAASSIYSSSFILSWNASTDNVGVTGYEVFKDGASIGTTTQTTMYVGGLNATTTYSITVRATDLAGNWSAQSAALNVTTSDPSGDWPNADNTGPSGTLTLHSGDLNATTDGMVIQNLNVTGKIFVRANNVTIRNCKVSAVDVRCDLPYTGCLVEDCEMNWVGRGNMTMRRCEMSSESDDLVRISGGDFIIEDCYLHVDGPKKEGAHADVIQAYPTETYNSVIRHNTLVAVDAVACINAADVTIENNLLIGGTYTIYGERVTVINNHFSTQLYPSGGIYGLYYPGTSAAFWSGNIWHETGAPAPYPHQSSAEVEEDIALNGTSVTKGITIYPNPLNGNTLNIKMEGYDQANIVIYDLIGKIVYNQSHNMVEQTGLQIPVDNLSNGIYIISVNGNRQKLVIE